MILLGLHIPSEEPTLYHRPTTFDITVSVHFFPHFIFSFHALQPRLAGIYGTMQFRTEIHRRRFPSPRRTTRRRQTKEARKLLFLTLERERETHKCGRSRCEKRHFSTSFTPTRETDSLARSLSQSWLREVMEKNTTRWGGVVFGEGGYKLVF